MALIINHNMPAMIAARNLGSIYGSLSKSIERLSSGLRINRAADDAAGLAVREMMRADISTTLQGIRNASDAVSLIQTADGALAVIDAKLIRMKELAEQAATGTYTDFQREIINSEFQAMAAEIDRIAVATNFNGIKLLDGSMSAQNGGSGIRIHFGVGNNAAEDYYYIMTDDTRASTATGLNIGGDSLNDIWATGGSPDAGLIGCCGGTFGALTDIAQTNSGMGFAYAYNWDLNPNFIADNGSSMVNFDNAGRYLAGRYGGLDSGMTVQQLIDAVNLGTQSRGLVTITGDIEGDDTQAQYAAFCLSSSEAVYVGTSVALKADLGTGKTLYQVAGGTITATALVSAINTRSPTFWAMGAGDQVLIFYREGGDKNSNELGFRTNVAANNDLVEFTNLSTGQVDSTGTKLSFGGEHWGNMTHTVAGGNSINLALNGANAGEGYDLKVVDDTNGTFLGNITSDITGGAKNIAKLAGTMFEVQDAVDGRGSIRTQETAQRALIDITTAIQRKDEIRARLGATQNRLEATIENLTVQAENLQASESRISDVDVATEMTEFTKNNILAQAAASMLAQANSLSSLALTLIRG
ncbi:MAG: flagellin [Deltaproteobacteria bacterium]|nr:flagellin [Deltaproteobacteria bacterium]